mgnify:CR=1 FL=1
MLVVKNLESDPWGFLALAPVLMAGFCAGATGEMIFCCRAEPPRRGGAAQAQRYRDAPPCGNTETKWNLMEKWRTSRLHDDKKGRKSIEIYSRLMYIRSMLRSTHHEEERDRSTQAITTEWEAIPNCSRDCKNADGSTGFDW